ncbi:MAG: hypothetical protein HC895_01075 [Leptolyngbyaceae cyanobacterium SM1_3_5]|nr:hypothetical protein [Leptolyngbyaceae cyanobacterium SM1_3_5]
MKLPNAEATFIDLAKLQNYSLNLQHDRGQHKARLFAAILGLSSDDTESYEGATSATFEKYSSQAESQCMEAVAPPSTPKRAAIIAKAAFCPKCTRLV